MKRTPLKSKTPLKAKAPAKRSKLTATGSKPRKSKSDLQKLKKALWDECRRITRARHGNTCYTCGKTGLEGSNWQTGHFISSSICSVALRYHLDNLRPQCYNCNINKSGFWTAFEDHLVRDFGKGFPEILKELNRNTKGLQYDILYYQDKLDEYKRL